MEPRERVLASLRRERPDRIPFELDLTESLLKEFRERTGTEDFAEYYGLDTRTVKVGPTRLKTDFSKYLPELPEGTEVDEWGVGHRPGSLYHFTKMIHPMAKFESIDELKEYPFPDLDADYRYEGMKEKVEELHSRGLFVDGSVGHIFENAWYMRGLDNLLVDFYQNPEFAEYLLDKITDMNSVIGARMAEAGVDMLRYGDDVGTQKALMMSPEIWRRFLKPRLARQIAAAKKINPNIHIWYHSDGNIADIIEDIIEAGVDVLNPVQPECLDPVWVKKQFGDRITLWGTIGTQTVMPFGTPEDVRKQVKKNIEELGFNGGLVLAPTHVLEPDVPWENIEAFVEACKEG